MPEFKSAGGSSTSNKKGGDSLKTGPGGGKFDRSAGAAAEDPLR